MVCAGLPALEAMCGRPACPGGGHGMCWFACPGGHVWSACLPRRPYVVGLPRRLYVVGLPALEVAMVCAGLPAPEAICGWPACLGGGAMVWAGLPAPGGGG